MDHHGPPRHELRQEKLFADARATLSEELNVFVVNTLGSSCQASSPPKSPLPFC